MTDAQTVPETVQPSTEIQKIAIALQAQPELTELDQANGELSRELKKWKKAFTDLLSHAHALEQRQAQLLEARLAHVAEIAGLKAENEHLKSQVTQPEVPAESTPPEEPAP